MSADLIDPQNIPQFTGDLEQLGTDHMLLTGEALVFRQSGSDVHTRFQGLSACYTAPEAEQLFATTAPVAAKADEFADDLEKVAAALSSYETEIQPLVARLKGLKQRAETFRHQIAGDDDWREDDDNVQLNNDLVHDVNATTAAFWQAEITCHNKITALVGGSTLVLEDGAEKRLVERGTSTYGFTADLLNQSEELPWGRTVEKERHGLDWLGHQVWEFGKGFVVDGVWGTIRGLGTLVGVDGWDAAGEAWKGLGKLATGVLITAVPVVGVAYWMMPEDKLPSYLRDSRNAVKETGKALVAWDQWGENPARASGAVTFNVLTTVFTGGAGAAAKSGAVARTVGALGRTARLVDPMTYLGKAATFGTVKVADLFAGLRGVHAGAYDDILSGAGRVQPDGSAVRVADDTPVIRDNVVEWPDGTRLNLDDGSVVRADGTTAPAKVELSAADRELLERSLPHEEGALVGAGDRAGAHAAGGTAAHVGGDATGRAGGNTAATAHATDHTGGHTTGSDGNAGSGRNAGGGGADSSAIPAQHGGTGGHAGGDGRGTPLERGDGSAPQTSRSGEATHSGNGVGHQGNGGPNDLGRTGDDVPGNEPEGTTPGRLAGVQRPDFMREGDNPYGPRGSLTREQIEEIQVYRANHEPGYFERYYKENGWRKRLKLRDESGFTPPQLAQMSENAPWIRAKDTPAAPEPHFLDDDYISVGPDTVTSKDRLRILDAAADKRHSAVEWDNTVKRWKTEAEIADGIHSTADSVAQRVEAGATYKESHTAMGRSAEEFGEMAAEYHYIAEHYPDFGKQPLLGPKNGNDQFDQVWKHEDGRVIVIEAKSSTETDLGSRTLPDGQRVSQGSREYFFDIMKAMRARGEFDALEALEEALSKEKLEYAVVKGEKNSGVYSGLQYRRFDISKGTLP
ncbi:hypothetical protein [Streptomyces sp. NPDC058625]|uniref:hypothetical protein n=1 Tax=Streptomyces sp. NPDC058625 TaxID=3346564 RepID=UPI0036554853